VYAWLIAKFECNWLAKRIAVRPQMMPHNISCAPPRHAARQPPSRSPTGMAAQHRRRRTAAGDGPAQAANASVHYQAPLKLQRRTEGQARAAASQSPKCCSVSMVFDTSHAANLVQLCAACAQPRTAPGLRGCHHALAHRAARSGPSPSSSASQSSSLKDRSRTSFPRRPAADSASAPKAAGRGPGGAAPASGGRGAQLKEADRAGGDGERAPGSRSPSESSPSVAWPPGRRQ
jgi:hypothetical protein